MYNVNKTLVNLQCVTCKGWEKEIVQRELIQLVPSMEQRLERRESRLLNGVIFQIE